MSDYSLYVSMIAQTLQDDDTLNALVDGQIISGFRRAMADQYLTGTNKACIGVRNLDDTSNGLPGCFYHGTSKHDQLIEIRVITKISAIRQDDSYAAGIGARIEALLKGGITKTMNGIEYQIPAVGQISFTPLDDDQFHDRIEIQGVIKIGYFG
jgi:hypothetical protein